MIFKDFYWVIKLKLDFKKYFFDFLLLENSNKNGLNTKKIFKIYNKKIKKLFDKILKWSNIMMMKDPKSPLLLKQWDTSFEGKSIPILNNNVFRFLMEI